MSAAGAVQLALSTLLFMLGASAGKHWALAPSAPRLLLVLFLYSAGNLLMLRLIREFGMGIAVSLSAVVQLVAVNLVAFAWFHERVTTLQSLGIVLAIVTVALITLGPALEAN